VQVKNYIQQEVSLFKQNTADLEEETSGKKIPERKE
jgi:hypothetical protein